MSTDIDTLSTAELCKIINDQDALVAPAVGEVLPAIAEAIDAIVERIEAGGRLLYMGAGSSGRLGVLDAAELPPTYAADNMQYIALIAGGDGALRTAREAIEDSREAGRADLDALFPTSNDALIGITSSGRTPYVLGALQRAHELGLLTIGLVCVRPSAVRMERNCTVVVDPVTGPEVITGSTRMKAGTATKMALNMISTGVQIKLGKTYGNLMIDLNASNHKLVSRARRIIRTIAAEVGLPPSYASIFTDDDQLDTVIRRCDGSVKLALVVVVTGWGVDLCREALTRRGGVLRAVLDDVRFETVARVFKV